MPDGRLTCFPALALVSDTDRTQTIERARQWAQALLGRHVNTNKVSSTNLLFSELPPGSGAEIENHGFGTAYRYRGTAEEMDECCYAAILLWMVAVYPSLWEQSVRGAVSEGEEIVLPRTIRLAVLTGAYGVMSANTNRVVKSRGKEVTNRVVWERKRMQSEMDGVMAILALVMRGQGEEEFRWQVAEILKGWVDSGVFGSGKGETILPEKIWGVIQLVGMAPLAVMQEAGVPEDWRVRMADRLVSRQQYGGLWEGSLWETVCAIWALEALLGENVDGSR